MRSKWEVSFYETLRDLVDIFAAWAALELLEKLEDIDLQLYHVQRTDQGIIEFRGDEKAQVFNFQVKWIFFSIGEVFLLGFVLFSFLSSVDSLRGGDCLSLGSVHVYLLVF